MNNRGLFVVATDTGAGKTAVTACLCAALLRRGADVVALKPLESGCLVTPQGLVGPDSAWLARLTDGDPGANVVERFTWPVAPATAARLAGVERLDVAELAERLVSLIPADALALVEGIGGLLVPINESQSVADLAAALGLPLLLVVANRPGCINHALLSVEAIARRNLPLAGWVLCDAERVAADDVARIENRIELTERLAAPCLGALPFVEGLAALPADRLAEAAEQHLAPLLELLARQD